MDISIENDVPTSSLAAMYFFLISIRTITTLLIRYLFSALTRPLSTQAKLRCLELMRPEQSKRIVENAIKGRTYHQVRILATRHLVSKHAGVGCPNVGFKAGIEHANLRPVKVEGLYIGIANTRAKTGLFKG